MSSLHRPQAPPLSPELVQPPPGGSCRSSDTVVFIPSLCGRPPSSPVGASDSDWHPWKRNSKLRHQTDLDRSAFFATFSFFPGNDSPEVLLRAVRFWEPWRLIRSRAAGDSNGERLKSARRNRTSSTRYLSIAKIVYETV